MYSAIITSNNFFDDKKYLKSLNDLQSNQNTSNSQTFLEKIINNFPFKRSKSFQFFLRFLGMKIGKNVKFLGDVNFKIRGKISNIIQERSIDVMITRLRQKLEVDPKNPKYLQTIRGSGYVLWIE